MLSAVSLPVSFEPVERSIGIDTELPETDAAGAPAEWVAWGCHGFLRNTDAPSQTDARVAFRRLGDGEVYEEVLRTVPAAALGLMPLGSVWQGNRSERQIVLTTRAFDVDHVEGQWSFTSFAEAAETGGAPPFPRKRAPPHESAERIRYLVLNLASGGRLVISCAEYFTRLYGVSHYLRQVLLGYPWVSEGHPKNRLYGNPRIALEPDAWAVRLRPRLDDRDAIFLAHAKYDPFTARAAKRPYAPGSRHPSIRRLRLRRSAAMLALGTRGGRNQVPSVVLDVVVDAAWRRIDLGYADEVPTRELSVGRDAPWRPRWADRAREPPQARQANELA